MNTDRIIAIVILAVIVIGGIGLIYWSQHKSSTPPSQVAQQQQQPKQPSSVAQPAHTAPTGAEVQDAKAHGTYHIRIETAKGDIEVDLRGDLLPLTVANFVKLAKSGFYDGLTFHRVEDWVIQGGDPRGDGTGGPGYSINLETDSQLKNVRGAIAMARSQDPNSAGSQFYILKTDADWLNGQYAVFGNVTKGMDVVDKITVGDVIDKIVIVD